MIAPRFFRSISLTKWDTARPKMAPIESAINTFLQNTGQYPATLEDLILDPQITGWAGPYLKENQLYDPWNRLYIYIPNGTNNPGTYDLISYGNDGQPGGEGFNEDVYNY